MNDKPAIEENEWDFDSCIEYTPEYRRKVLEFGLDRTRKQAGRILADLLEEVNHADPDIDKIRQLAAGIERESKRARTLTLGLCRR